MEWLEKVRRRWRSTFASSVLSTIGLASGCRCRAPCHAGGARASARSGAAELAQDLVHRAGGLGAARRADDLRGHARDRRVARHRLQHHGAGRDPGALADLDVAEDLGAGTDQHALADLRMAVAALLAGAAE